MPDPRPPADPAPLHHVCVVGSGPAGMVLTLELARLGCRVTLVESGDREPHAGAQALSDAGFDEHGTHAPMADAVHRRFGGTSHLWGGRCVPFDPLDFEARPGVRDAGWPLAPAAIVARYAEACAYADCGDATFRLQDAYGDRPAAPIVEGFVDGPIRADHLERWCAAPVLVDRLGPRIEAHPRVVRRLGTTCTGLVLEGGGQRIAGVRVAASDGSGGADTILADAVVLACGGVESTRLLLHFLRQPEPPRIDGRAFLGRGYMGHLSGKIAGIRLAGDPARTVYDFEKVDGHYLRRRFTLADATLRDRGLLNIAMWLDNPPPADARHGSGILSAAYLAMRAPLLGRRLAPNAIRQSLLTTGRGGGLGRHLANVVRRLPSTLAFVARFVRARYFAMPRLPGFFAYSPANVYALHFHAEQTPNDASRIELDPTATDALGVPRARLGLRFHRRDAESVVEAHRVLDEHLRAHGLGELDYLYPEAERVDAVLRQARDGFHQIGSARMAASAEGGVTDDQGRVFGTDCLYLCSSAVFPTSGQANPTLTILAFAIRQAAHLAAGAAPR